MTYKLPLEVHFAKRLL
ncbi:hypothetical protein OSR38_03010 [Rickettsia conorii subsp. heilongjiangensis]|nr:hypothetical protein [Rickettsia conorii]UZW39319.1 hypothetical protein OSR38_03010 [Rickettsia conorii subsp. heilongjiangensis]